MELTWIDAVVFAGFMTTVVVVSLYAGRKEQSSEDYFLAGRKLTWPLIGFSLIASNISTEHFVGMAGKGFGTVGLAIASYEWIAAITLVFVAWWLLPKFLRAGIYTMPEFLEYRYSGGTRAIMATYLLVLYMVNLLVVVLYTGAKYVNIIFDIPSIFEHRFGLGPQAAEFWALVASVWAIGAIAATYTVYGGLKAVVWSDLLQGGGLLLGALIVTVLTLRLIGGDVTAGGEMAAGGLIEGWRRFTEASSDKLHTVLASDHPELPWTAIVLGGIWIPNIFYWGLNQFITQRTLGARSLAEGQKGIMFAAGLKLLIPFIIVMPGIMAYQLYGDELVQDAARAHLEGSGDVQDVVAVPAGAVEALPEIDLAALPEKDRTKILEKAGENAYPFLMKKVLPPWLRGIMFAALCGAVMSTINSGLNSASTIFTIDLYVRYVDRGASAKRQVFVGRLATAVIVVVACFLAPFLLYFPAGVFTYIQAIWGFISPGIVTVFLVGLLVKKAPAGAAKTALLVGVPLYGFFRFGQHLWGVPPEGVELLGLHRAVADFNDWPFLHHMMLILVILTAIMLVMTVISPLRRPVTLPQSNLDLTAHPRVHLVGGVIIAATVALYILFW